LTLHPAEGFTLLSGAEHIVVHATRWIFDFWFVVGSVQDGVGDEREPT
jgi:hypothetical protein